MVSIGLDVIGVARIWVSYFIWRSEALVGAVKSLERFRALLVA